MLGQLSIGQASAMARNLPESKVGLKPQEAHSMQQGCCQAEKEVLFQKKMREDQKKHTTVKFKRQMSDIRKIRVCQPHLTENSTEFIPSIVRKTVQKI